LYGDGGVVTAVLGCGMPRQLRDWRERVVNRVPWEEQEGLAEAMQAG
jgi:hypothetical protein